MLTINAIQSWNSRSFISLFSPTRIQFKRRSSLWSQNLTYCSMIIKFANNSKALFLSVVSCSQYNRICVVKSNVCLLHKLHCLRNCFILPILMIDDNIILKFGWTYAIFQKIWTLILGWISHVDWNVPCITYIPKCVDYVLYTYHFGITRNLYDVVLTNFSTIRSIFENSNDLIVRHEVQRGILRSSL